MNDVLELKPEGLYCPVGDFYIDPWRPVKTAVITHGHADHARNGSAVYHAEKSGIPILQWRLGEANDHQRYISHDYGETFRLGDAKVSLHSAGHVLGSAQVRIEVDNAVWVVSGDYKRDDDPTCAPFEVVNCDVFVTEATFAMPVYRWPAPTQVAQQILDWWNHCRNRGETALLLCYALGKAQRILAELARLPTIGERRVLLHGAMQRGVDIYRVAGIHMLATEPVTEQGKASTFAGELVLAPPSALGSPWAKRFRHASVGFASGWMRLRGNRHRRSFDRGFVLSDHADWPSLLRTVKETGAKKVLATHGNTDAFVRLLQEQGIDAIALQTELGGEN